MIFCVRSVGGVNEGGRSSSFVAAKRFVNIFAMLRHGSFYSKTRLSKRAADS